jgi:hypothetical protein
VVADRGAGTYTAVLPLRGHDFALLGPDDQDRRVAGWAGLLASLAREGSVVHRVQWVAATVPDDGRGVRAHLAERAVLGADAPARRSYAEVLDEAAGGAYRHDVHLAVALRPGRRSGAASRWPGWRGPAGACAALLREVGSLGRRLGEMDVAVGSALSPGDLGTLIRRAVEPEPVAGEVGTTWPWPLATRAHWDHLQADGTVHATYWIAEWPRVDVGPDFLGPLLLGPVRRAVSVVMEPLSPSRATRQVEQARTADLADGELRRRGGFLATARRQREADLLRQREGELADGHASFRFSGYVTVTAATAERLAAACEATEHAAGQCRLELRRLYGDQEASFAFTLPLCRGLA